MKGTLVHHYLTVPENTDGCSVPSLCPLETASIKFMLTLFVDAVVHSKAVVCDATHAEAYNNLGALEHRKENFEQANAHYAAATDLYVCKVCTSVPPIFGGTAGKREI